MRVFSPDEDIEWTNDVLGRFDYQVIWVLDGRGSDELRETLLHEVLHAVDHSAHAEAGEAVVGSFAPVLLDVLRDNPDLASCLVSEP